MIQIEADIKAPVQKVWTSYNEPEDIKEWNQASPDWHCPASENDLRTGGRFKNTMAAKDGSFQFDFEGTYTEVVPLKKISYTMDDQRKANIFFTDKGQDTKMLIEFDAEQINPVDMQKEGWQAILYSFKNYVEKH